MSRPIILVGLMICAQVLYAEEPLTVAVASNFAPTGQLLVGAFESQSATRVRLVTGSTGSLYAQIRNGAPYDVFLSADSKRPQLLGSAGMAVSDSQRTYAVGQLVIWSRENACRLEDWTEGRLAIANPALAPYGNAATEFLEDAQLWRVLEPHLVYGENISQTYQFVATRNAKAGLVAASQLVDTPPNDKDCVYPIPAESHTPIKQDAVLLSRAADNAAAKNFMLFLTSDSARRLISDRGYRLPPVPPR